ncbi:hypothetical protein Y032_0002g693 [Ancylostoma ceylanicum]|uniref:Uncharacterized protein n=1 Tax=Ancylostoma ceylanicum TaxID=53326 RepID=A0A016W084_9BILA|nr:hypothetical protein Y032_0002g693 [Ancylostoma ceylanicum]
MPAEPLSRKTHCPNDTTVLVFVYTRVYHLEQSLDELIGRTPEFSESHSTAPPLLDRRLACAVVGPLISSRKLP